MSEKGLLNGKIAIDDIGIASLGINMKITTGTMYEDRIESRNKNTTFDLTTGNLKLNKANIKH